ncbi:D-alanyl-D-alanine carboxypeptidase family protein [Imhoffiella purpurea]|uniref:serine-type D-Ala-D-Ala carboxypeptidase n=1 Tax=Imhoffiella purpurea TaxID=1249627 RepID=W9VMA5_9GAMM|nr:D-alanyl-D-alanine carboxypeptidase family protein [Imhoffiella purpurea]EXJ17232.1 D-alanyl-D-alanine carboxypeptidase [Imhoffiella purpurea]
MKSALKLALPFLLVCLLPLSAVIAAPAQPAPEVAAKGYLLVDFNSGKVLAENNADERLEPASLTKIMTAYVVFREIAAGRIGLTDQVLVSEKAWRTGGSRMFIEVGTQVSVEDLLKGMIIQSGNDASVALAEHVAGSTEAFANLMNANAKRLGMENTHFTNPNGLPDPDLYTTARDLAKVTMALIREFPDFYSWYGSKEFTYNEITQPNRNPLLKRDPSADGVKTGHTNAAGYCLVGSAKRDDMRLVSVVMGAASPNARAQASLALLNWGFRYFESHSLYPADQPIENLRVWYGQQETLPVGPEADVVATIPRGSYSRLSARLEKTAELNAPIAKGTRIGDIVVTLGENEIIRAPLVALQDVPEGGLWRKAKDSVLQMF